MKFICDQCKAKYQIADDKIAGKTVRMKCRKCGHQIEVRAEVTESSVASRAPSADAAGSLASPAPPGVARPASPAGPAAPRPAMKPASPGPRVGPLATSLASAKPAAPRAASLPPKPATSGERSGGGGALAGAFKSSVGKEEEISASFDLAELSAADEWYAAINGVPVGPIRIAEIRRKAALGAVTEDSLVWQEGLEEWRPVRAFAELATIVREAATGGRTSLMTPSPPDVRASRPAPARPSAPPRGHAPGTPLAPATSPIPPPARTPYSPSAAAIAARSNVVPITSRLGIASAERLDDATMAMHDEPRDSRVAADPFASPSATGAAAMSASLGTPPPSPSYAEALPPVLAATATAVDAREASSKKAPPWIAIAMIVLAAAFGITAALALFLRQPAVAPAPVVIQMPSGVAPPQAPTGTPQPTGQQDDPASPLPQASGTGGPRTGPGPVAMGTAAKPAPTGTASSGGFTLSGGLGVNRPTVDPNATSGNDGPKPPGQCLTQGQIQGVIGQHRIGVSRMCWDKSPSTRQSVNVGVTLAIGPGGEVQTVNATGEDNSVANCVANDVRNWRFPAGGCVQQTFFSLKFVKQ